MNSESDQCVSFFDTTIYWLRRVEVSSKKMLILCLECVMFQAATVNTANQFLWLCDPSYDEVAVQRALFEFVIAHPGRLVLVLLGESREELEARRNALSRSLHERGFFLFSDSCFVPPEIAYTLPWLHDQRMSQEFSGPPGNNTAEYVYSAPPPWLAGPWEDLGRRFANACDR